MKLLHITSITNPEGNGVANAVSNYLKFESKYAEVAVYNLESNINNNEIKTFNYSNYDSLESVINEFSKPDLIIFNEIYKFKYIKLYKECLKSNIPYIIIPHGCLVDVAQRKKIIKKKIGNFLFFNSFIKNAKAIQFLNENEKNKSVNKNKNYIISGNGIILPRKQNNYSNKYFIYIGRYDVKVKGLDLLIKTCSKNKKWFENNNVKINLYGRNSGNGYEKTKKLIKSNNVNNVIFLNDPIYGKNKENVLIDSYCFIQTSRHEGQPTGIMEALSYGVPCIVTYGTSFGEYVNNKKCGIGINFSEDELFAAIKKMYEDENYRNTCSNNSKKIKNDYDWEIVSSICINQYEVLL